MKKFSVALSLGFAAGIVDVIPMLIMNIDMNAIVSAFIHWLVLGIVIPFIKWDMRSWVKGMLVAVISALPIMALVYENGPADLVPIAISSLVLGALIGLFGKKWIHV